MDNMKLFMCSSIGIPSSRLNLGNHFNGWNGLAIWTAPRFVHGLWAIIGIYVEEYVLVVEGD